MARGTLWVPALLFFASLALANEIVVTPEEARLGDAIEITVRLEGEYARVSSLRLPITNLVIERGPFTSTEFRWVNGVSSRTKTFRYVARGRRVGRAAVGPIELVGAGNERLHLPAVTFNILPESALPNDPSAALEQARVRGGIFVTVEANRTEAFLGEQINLTWTLYSRKPLRGYRLTSVPILEKFWTEEVPQSRRDVEQTILNGEVLQKAIVRRVAVFPLAAGKVNIAPVEVLAEVVEDDGFLRGWGLFENRFEEYRVRSGSLDINVKPLPSTASAVGETTLECRAAVVPATGPVRVDVFVSGTGNLRAADVPEFESSPQALVEVQSRETMVDRETQPVRMTRHWRLLLFPRAAGTLAVPPLRFEYFDPASGRNTVARCDEQRVAVSRQNIAPPAAAITTAAAGDSPRPPERPRVQLPVVIGIAALAITGVAWAGALRRRGDTGLVAELCDASAEPRELRRRLHDAVADANLRVADLFQEQSDLGDAFRALHSLIDLMEKEPWEVPTATDELRKRAREFARQLAKRG